MPNNKNSRKNTKQTKQVAEKPMADATAPATNNDDDWGCILVKSNPNSRNSTRSNKSKKSEPESQPEPVPEPPKPEWELVGMTEEDYKAMRERVNKMMLESQIETYKQNLLAEWDSIGYWEHRIETLERNRERYNKKRGWSAEDIAEVDQIDAEIKECENHIARIEGEDAFDEYEDEIAAY